MQKPAPALRINSDPKPAPKPVPPIKTGPAPWIPTGPDGGDARAFAEVPGHPSHLYLGTLDSWVYESFDHGASWRRLAKLDKDDDLVLDSILVDPSQPTTIYIGAWKLGQSGGGLWVSHDAGKDWTASAGLRDQSIRALAQAPSDPKLLFAGTLQGVFRSEDSGNTWTLISPPGSRELHEVESLAINPTNPDIIYAGTWHLPWKTTDGGKNWENMKQGIIEDSDVFSIIIDPAQPSTMFLSACSGIYKSDNAGALFHKIAGIPSDARRTRVLMQDPSNHDVVYAGTTEGLYKTVDGGKKFSPMTGADVIINDIYVDPGDPSQILLATDRGGVLTSKDGGATFAPSNSGISGRKVEALLVDRADPRRVYAGVVNDKTFGGVFVSSDGGKGWDHAGQGLEGRDVFALGQTAKGEVIAGTSHGIFALAGDSGSLHWEPRNKIVNTVFKPVAERHAGKRVTVEKTVKEAEVTLVSRVPAIDVSGDVWLASTGVGLLTSKDQGTTWQGGPVGGVEAYASVAAHGSDMAAARPDGVVASSDSGATWAPMSIPSSLTRVHRIAFSPDGALWLGAREGVYFTRDMGKSWLWLQRLPFRDVDDLSYDAATGRVLVSSRSSDQIFAIDPKLLAWNWWQTGFHINLVRAAGQSILAASMFDGVLVEPATAGVVSSLK